jgi:hypothetical protein
MTGGGLGCSGSYIRSSDLVVVDAPAFEAGMIGSEPLSRKLGGVRRRALPTQLCVKCDTFMVANNFLQASDRSSLRVGIASL